MVSTQIHYGMRNGELVHIDDVESGLACACKCPECLRPLVAKKGEIRAHHFAHDADDVNCNPTPESLIHSYAKQQVSKFKKLVLPAFTVRAEYETNDSQVHELCWRFHPHYFLDVDSAEVEAEVQLNSISVKPDVLFHTVHWRLAVEIYFRHQVPFEKIEKLQINLHLSTVEINLSDLPTDTSSQTINKAINDPRRWKWLHNQHEIYIRSDMNSMLRRSVDIFVPHAPRAEAKIGMNRLPSRKLATADGMMCRVPQLANELQHAPPHIAIHRVRSLGTEMRIALHCHYIGLRPTQLPKNMMQTTDGAGVLGMHPVLWQTGVFAKFCMAGGAFTAQAVERWVRNAFDDKALQTLESITQSTNGFSPVAQALYHFLCDLSAQGLLRELKGYRRWESRFAPIRTTKAEVLELIKELPSAAEDL